MTGVVCATLACLALLDGAFSGFRASLGRTGLVNHAAEDRRGLLHGTVSALLLAVPAIIAMAIDLTSGKGTLAPYREAGLAFLAVIGPYALIVLLAVAAYAALGWELRYLASALILGPFTLIRPYVVIAATVLSTTQVRAVGTTITTLLATAAVLLVEPISNLRHKR